MPRVVVFLRAINVGGRFVKMAELAGHVAALGHTGVATFINSGNVLLDTRARDLTRLAAELEAGLAPRLGFHAEAFVRSAAEVQALAERGAALQARVPDDGDVNVAFFSQALSPAQRAAVDALANANDAFEHGERELFWLSQQRQSASGFSNALLERRLKLRTTFRRASMLGKLAVQLTA